ncbi:putative F-box/kelch-repeat protein At2g29780 isoform X4 [Capsella rubella]|uniref:putative F-box/kelch-repeat protein At2g29780 isoform X4 n=1 Tax=Capsella rubella TaxID=81985 RepID=UPI000CD4B9C2|nr:putative F-box/kelch-repeat protein At2g29780 isoform X4 [Capsella rubella]
MAIISETSDNVSYSGGPSKNQKVVKEEEYQDEKAKEDDQEEEEVENLDHVTPYIPEELCEITVARVQRCHYPRLSLLSKAFRDVISSEQLFVTRSDLGVTEPVLYTLISSPPFDPPSWYILHRSNISLRLSRVTSLPPMFPGCTAVTIGHKIYVMGGCTGVNQPIKTVIVIDCRFHKWECVKSMKRERCYAASGVIDGKIYVVGGRKKRYNDWVEVFDVENGVWETRTWSSVPDPSDCNSSMPGGGFVTSVVMQDRIYILDAMRGLVYEPRQGTWQSWELGSKLMYFWRKPCCVIEDLLYCFDPRCVLRHPILVYDPDEMVWSPLKDTWCIEIVLERRERGEIWGKVVSVTPVLRSENSPYIDLCSSVTF